MKVSTMVIGLGNNRFLICRSEQDWREREDVFYLIGSKEEKKVLLFIQENPDKINLRDDHQRS